MTNIRYGGRLYKILLKDFSTSVYCLGIFCFLLLLSTVCFQNMSTQVANHIGNYTKYFKHFSPVYFVYCLCISFIVCVFYLVVFLHLWIVPLSTESQSAWQLYKIVEKDFWKSVNGADQPIVLWVDQTNPLWFLPAQAALYVMMLYYISSKANFRFWDYCQWT